jgi:malonyl-CoA O-methyltransferase
MRELKALGAHNVTAGRPRGLGGRGRLRALAAAYERYRDAGGRVPATFEVVYGHAWAPAAESDLRQGPGVYPVSLAGLRRSWRG